jgi:hypothetical protein
MNNDTTKLDNLFRGAAVAALALVLSAAPMTLAAGQTGGKAPAPKQTAKPNKPVTASAVTTAPAAEADVAGWEPVQAEVDRVKDLYRAITNYHLLLQGEGVNSQTVQAALYDAERYVDEIDNKYSTNKLFMKDQTALEEIRTTVAKAHFQVAILHARGVDLERSIMHYERTLDLLGMDPADWDQELERTARPGLLPQAQEVAFQVTTPRAAVEDLRSFWGSGVVTRFKSRDLTPTQRESIKLTRIGGRTDGFSEASFAVAAERFADRVGDGLDEFRVVLPAGRYQVASGDSSFPGFEFVLADGSYPDPIYVNPNTFSFTWATQDGKCRPTLVLNGIPVKTFTSVPYGTYQVQRQPNCEQRLPDKITVDQMAEVTLRTEPEKLDYVRDGQPIFLFITTPPGSSYTLRF